jgi:hypothetical protein
MQPSSEPLSAQRRLSWLEFPLPPLGLAQRAGQELEAAALRE